MPEIIWNAAKVIEQDERSYYRMDTIWDYLRTARSADGTLAFDKLAKVALLVLVLPHSNAEEETSQFKVGWYPFKHFNNQAC